MIAEAFEGWPHAIRRAMAAEKEAKQNLMWQLAWKNTAKEHEETIKYLQAKLRKAEADFRDVSYRLIVRNEEVEKLTAESKQSLPLRSIGNPEDLAEWEKEHPSDPEGMRRMRELFANHVRSKRILPDGTLERTREEIEDENAKLIADLKRIDSATMSHYASAEDMLRDVKRIAKEALSDVAK